MSTSEPNVFLVEFKINALHNLKSGSILTEEIRVMERLEDRLGEVYLGTIIKADTEKQAEPLGREIINEFLDYYCALFGTSLSIASDGDPHMFTQISGDRSRIAMPISLEIPSLFVYDEKISKEVFENIQLNRKRNFTYFRNAMYYYRKAKSEILNSTKLILYFIALEALFSTSGQEITYRFSNRLAVLLGNSNLEKISIKKDAVLFYNKRSRIVHGTETNVDKDTIEKIDGWISKSLRYFSELTEIYPKQDNLLEFLDDALLDKTVFKKLNEYRKPADDYYKKLKKEKIKSKSTSNNSKKSPT